jgi:hypothetical protein
MGRKRSLRQTSRSGNKSLKVLVVWGALVKIEQKRRSFLTEFRTKGEKNPRTFVYMILGKHGSVINDAPNKPRVPIKHL